MKISSATPNFMGRRDNVDAAINADDNTVRQLAYLKTASETDYKKQRKITNALIYSAPIAAGLGAAVLGSAKPTKIFSKPVSGLGARVANGMKVGALWTAGLVAIELLSQGAKSLRKNSSEFRDFERNHPVASTIIGIGSAFGLLSLTSKATEWLKDVKAPQFMQNATAKVNKFLNENRIVNRTTKFISENVAALPKSIKKAGKTAIYWAPEALLLSGILYGIKAGSKVNSDYQKNYAELKDRQSQIAKARVRELSMENDFLMQDAKNREEIALLENPTEGMPEEVLDAIDEIHAEEA